MADFRERMRRIVKPFTPFSLLAFLLLAATPVPAQEATPTAEQAPVEKPVTSEPEASPQPAAPARPATPEKASVTVRTGLHPTFGRIAFDWPQAATLEARAEGNKVTIRFNKPMTANLRPVLTTLSPYVAAADLDADGMGLTLTLKKPVTLKTIPNGTTVAVDLVEQPSQTVQTPAAPAQPKDNAAAPPKAAEPAKIAEAPKAPESAKTEPVRTQPAKPEAPKPETPKPAMSAAAEQTKLPVILQVSREKGGHRLSFQARSRLDLTISETDGIARIRFGRPVTLDIAPLTAALPGAAAQLMEEPRGTLLAMALPRGAKLKQSRGRNGPVIDLSEPANAAPATVTPPAGLAEPPALAAPAGAGAPRPLAAADAPAAPAEAVPVTPGVSSPVEASVADTPVQPASVAAAPAPSPPAVTPATVPASVGRLVIRYNEIPEGASLRFEWPVAVAAAAYRRSGSLYLVFSAPSNADLGELRGPGSATLTGVQQVADPTATIIRMTTRAVLNPSMHRSGTNWIIDLKSQELQPEAPIFADAQPSASPPRVYFPERQSSRPIRYRDPEVGDTLIVVPTSELGLGLREAISLVDFRALVSAQGLVIRPDNDDLIVRLTETGVEVTSPEGLTLSSDGDRILGQPMEAVPKLFDFVAWKGPADQPILRRRSVLELAIASAPTSARSRFRLDLARFYFANLYTAEAIGVLEAIVKDDAVLGSDITVRAMLGVCYFVTGDYKSASLQLRMRLLDGQPEVALWRGMLDGTEGNWQEAVSEFVKGISLVPNYPKPMRNRLALGIAEAVVNTDQEQGATPLLRLVLRDDPSVADRAMARYLEGRQYYSQGDIDRASDVWREVANLNDRPSRARALYSSVMARLGAKKESRAEAISELDSLRFAWRGDAFEFDLLRTLGKLKIEDGDYRGGLDALREAIGNFQDYPPVKAVQQAMTDSFTSFFLGKDADNVPPLKAVALYDEFKDLAPKGERGDELVRKLIDRLVEVDLLGQAAILLDTQVRTRLTGREKARVAAQLALVRLLDHKPGPAIEALDIDVGRDVPPELKRQRDQLRSRALVELGRTAEARSALADDTSRDADRLRADIAWRTQNWRDAAQVFARLARPAGADGKYDDETMRLVINWAAALTLSGDQPALAALRQKYGAAMNAGPYGDVFRIVSGDNSGVPSGESDPRLVASRVAQISELQSFMASYRQKLTTTKLSSIN